MVSMLMLSVLTLMVLSLLLLVVWVMVWYGGGRFPPPILPQGAGELAEDVTFDTRSSRVFACMSAGVYMSADEGASFVFVSIPALAMGTAPAGGVTRPTTTGCSAIEMVSSVVAGVPARLAVCSGGSHDHTTTAAGPCAVADVAADGTLSAWTVFITITGGIPIVEMAASERVLYALAGNGAVIRSPHANPKQISFGGFGIANGLQVQPRLPLI